MAMLIIASLLGAGLWTALGGGFSLSQEEPPVAEPERPSFEITYIDCTEGKPQCIAIVLINNKDFTTEEHLALWVRLSIFFDQVVKEVGSKDAVLVVGFVVEKTFIRTVEGVEEEYPLYYFTRMVAIRTDITAPLALYRPRTREEYDELTKGAILLEGTVPDYPFTQEGAINFVRYALSTAIDYWYPPKA